MWISVRRRALVPLLLLSLSVLPSIAQSQGRKGMITVEVGLLTTTHILFTSDLTYVDISSKDVIKAKVVEASKNLLALKATKEFDFVTTVSALEANGTMHTFYVRFNPDPAVLTVDTRVQNSSVVAQVNTQIRPDPQPVEVAEDHSSQSRRNRREERQETAPVVRQETPVNGVSVTSGNMSNFGRGDAPTIEEVMRKDWGLFHVVDKCYGLQASVVNVFAYSDLTYIVISLKNPTDIGFEAGDAQFTVESKKISAKTLVTDKPVWPKSSYGTLSCAPGSETLIGYTIPKMTLQKNEVLKIYIYEKNGTRNLFLTLDDKDVNFAVSPF